MTNTSTNTSLDTTELRWFFEGTLPERVIAWFSDTVEPTLTEERSDEYHVSDRADTGLKRRHGATLELKLRQGEPTAIELAPGLLDSVERWRRWSPADHVVDIIPHDHWMPVHKTAFKRRFSQHGDELPLYASNRSTYNIGCDVEIATVSFANEVSWTFAFSAYGADVDHIEILQAAAAALNLDHVDAPTPLLQAGTCCGYPEWLARTQVAR